MTKGTIAAFMKRNLVTVTMIPTLVLVHYGWYMLQRVDSLVREDERKEGFPIVDLFNKLTHSGAKNMDSNIRQFRHQAD